MPTGIEIRNRNRRARKFKDGAVNTMKSIRNVIVVFLLFVVIALGVVYGSHSMKTNAEINMLADAGLYKQVLVEENRSMNVSSYGNENSGHTIVPISGIGNQDFTVFAQHMMATIKDMARVAFIDRAGYGFSDDSNEAQTVEQIVSDYRAGLTNANIDGPYILLAHEFGGVYATYWAITYPDEVEAVIYLDGTELLEHTHIENQVTNGEDVVWSVLCKLGFQRILYHDFYNHISKSLTKQEADCAKALNVHSVNTRSYLSEISLKGTNFKTVLDMFKSTNMPKMYISSTNAFTTEKDVVKYYEYKNEQCEELGLEPFYVLGENEEQVKKDAEKFISECKNKYKSNTKSFAKILGNCQLTRIPGDEKIYEHKPEAVTDAIKDFLLYLNGDLGGIKEYYDDTKVINWENYKDEHKAEFDVPETTEANDA